MDLEVIIWESHILLMYTCWFRGLGEGESFHGFISFVSSLAQLYFLPFCPGHLPFSSLPPLALGSAGWQGCWPEPQEPGQWPSGSGVGG